MTLHDVLPLLVPNYLSSPTRIKRYRRHIQKNIQRAHLVITDSEFSKTQILKEFEIDHEPVVVYPASPLRFNDQAHARRETPDEYFLYCGGYDKRKGIEELAATFVRLWETEGFQVPLLMAGEAHHYSEKLALLLEAGKKSGAIRELGYVSDAELVGLYQNALALIYPSRYEGFGLPPLEAMTAGCPVITYALTSIPEVCGDAALYLDPDDDSSLEKAVESLATNAELRRRMSAQGRIQAQKFSWRESGQVFLNAVNASYLAKIG